MTSTDRTTVRRLPDRGRYDRETLYAILDEAPICTVAFVYQGSPAAIPTIHARVDDTIYLHGSNVSRTLLAIDETEVCVSATLLDGLVVARSAFHSSMNYRSAVVYGRARDVTDRQEKLAAMEAVVEHVLPGRWTEARGPTPAEIAGTKIVAVSIDEASSKVRTGPPIDDEEDHALPIWAGVVPLNVTPGEPVVETPALDVPASVGAMLQRRG